eukprot:674474-Prymnesium_polylepis.1
MARGHRFFLGPERRGGAESAPVRRHSCTELGQRLAGETFPHLSGKRNVLSRGAKPPLTAVPDTRAADGVRDRYTRGSKRPVRAGVSTSFEYNRHAA